MPNNTIAERGLLPCPFCGGAAYVSSVPAEPQYVGKAFCSVCGASIIGDHLGTVCTAWNTRALSSTPPPAGDVEVVAGNETIVCVRETANHVTGGNCTFVDDDVKLLGELARRAIKAGLIEGFDRPTTYNLDKVRQELIAEDAAMPTNGGWRDIVESCRQRALMLFQSYARGVAEAHGRGEDQFVHDVDTFASALADAFAYPASALPSPPGTDPSTVGEDRIDPALREECEKRVDAEIALNRLVKAVSSLEVFSHNAALGEELDAAVAEGQRVLDNINEDGWLHGDPPLQTEGEG